MCAWGSACVKVTEQLFRSGFSPSTPGDGTQILGLDGRHLTRWATSKAWFAITLFIGLFGVQGAHMPRYKCGHHRTTLGVSSAFHHVNAGAGTWILGWKQLPLTQSVILRGPRRQFWWMAWLLGKKPPQKAYFCKGLTPFPCVTLNKDFWSTGTQTPPITLVTRPSVDRRLGNLFIWRGAGGRMWDGRFGNTLNEWRDGQMSRSKDTSTSLKMKNQTSTQAIGTVAAALKG